MNKSLTCLLLCAALTACESDYLGTAESQLVVEGWIENEGYPVVILSRSVPISEDYTPMDELDQYLLRWAKVTVSDGQNSVVLTGKYDSGYFPPYIYTTGRLKGRAGKSYTLTVEYRDYYATATTTIPPTTVRPDFFVEKCADSDTLYQVKVSFSDPPGEKNYYQLFARTGADSKQYLASYLGSIDDAVLADHTEYTVYRGRKLGAGTDYTPYFAEQDTVAVKLAQVDKASYQFWDGFTKNLSLEGNLFLAPYTNVRTNVTGGTGYWCGMNSSTAYFIIPHPIPDRLPPEEP